MSARLALGALTLALLSAAPVAASPGSRSGFGARAQALASAIVAQPEGPSAVFANPAGLVASPDTELSLGYGWTGYELASDGRDAGFPSVPALDVGLLVPGAIAGVPVAFGLDLSLPDGRFSKLHGAEPDRAYWPLDDSGPRLLDLGVALAVRPFEAFAFGAGVGFLAAARGGFTVVGTAVPADGSGSEYESDLRHAVDADLVTIRYPILGATLAVSKRFTFGVAYRGSASIEQRIVGLLAGNVRIGTVDIPVRYAFETRAALAFVPGVLALGARARPWPELSLSAEVDWEAWSAYPSPYAHTSSTLAVTPPPGLDVSLPPTEPGARPPVELTDRLVPRLGVEQRFELGRSFDLLGRLGYAFERSPVPSRQHGTLLFDLDRHAFGAGAGARWRRPFAPLRELGLDLSASYALGAARSVTAVSASAPERHRLSGHVLGVGATLGLRFGSAGDEP